MVILLKVKLNQNKNYNKQLNFAQNSMNQIRTTQSLHNPDLCSPLEAESDTETFEIGDFTDNSSDQEDGPNIYATELDSANIKNAEKSSKWHSGLAPPNIKRMYNCKPKINSEMIE